MKCDGKFKAKTMNDNTCINNAKYIARSNVDPVTCVYYCCEQCVNSYRRNGFIIEEL